jgi:hypothetical protein
VEAHQSVDFGDRGETAFDGRQRVGVGQTTDADRDIGSKKRPCAFDGGPLDGLTGGRQSAFS